MAKEKGMTVTETAPVLLGINQQVHVVSQGKGGVGKSLVASLLAQYFRDEYGSVACYDTDPNNQTLKGYQDLDVSFLSILEGNKINQQSFDLLIEQVVTQPGPWVVDTGATSFFPWWDYVAQTGLVDVLRESDRRLIVHCPVVGGQAFGDTLQGLNAICEVMPERSVIVWLNGFFGKVKADEKEFEDLQIFRDNYLKFAGVIRFGDQSRELLSLTLRDAVAESKTIRQKLAEPTPIMVKSRLRAIQREVNAQLRAAEL